MEGSEKYHLKEEFCICIHKYETLYQGQYSFILIFKIRGVIGDNGREITLRSLLYTACILHEVHLRNYFT